MMNALQILTDLAKPPSQSAEAQRALLSLLDGLAVRQRIPESMRDDMVNEAAFKLYGWATRGNVLTGKSEGAARGFIATTLRRTLVSQYRNQDPLRDSEPIVPEDHAEAGGREAFENNGDAAANNSGEAERIFEQALAPVLERLWARGRALKPDREADWMRAWDEILQLVAGKISLDQICAARGPGVKINTVHKDHSRIRDYAESECDKLRDEGLFDEEEWQHATDILIALKRDGVRPRDATRPGHKGGAR